MSRATNELASAAPAPIQPGRPATPTRLGPRLSRRHLIPLAIFAAVVLALGVGLTLNPRLVPSPLVGKPLPEFSLPRLDAPATPLTTADLRGKVSLLNVWATWCVGCRQEHPLLVEIGQGAGVPIYGLNYKDQFKPALDWLARYGNPYVTSGYDAEGRAGLDLGVYGLPETFVIDAKGHIAYKHVGPVTEAIWRDKLEPLIRALEDKDG